MSEVTLSEIGEGTESRKWGRAMIGGVAGMLAGGLVSGLILFAVGPYTIFNSAIQSPKVNAVWGELEPLPLMVSNLAGFALMLARLGAVHGLVFALIVNGLPTARLKRGLLYGLITWLLSNLFFELNGPFAILGEPLLLVGVELGIGFVGAMVEGVVISVVYGQR